MAKPVDRVTSRYALEALLLLGQRIRAARIERKLTMDETSTRAGISRALLRRIEHGDPGSAIGSVFEVATVVGVSLFEPDRSRLAGRCRIVGPRRCHLGGARGDRPGGPVRGRRVIG